MTFDPTLCRPAPQPVEGGGWDLEVRLADLEKPLNPDALFGRSAPLAIEIGSGSGLFLATEAARHPGTNFLAIEKERSEVFRAKDKWNRRALWNTRVIHCDAHYFLEEYPRDHAVARYIILFSDPWFKKRHHKRRVFQPRLVPILERTLAPGGELFIKTDITEYHTVMRELLDPQPFLEVVDERDVNINPPADDIVTNYQRKAVLAGRPIHQVIYRRR